MLALDYTIGSISTALKAEILAGDPGSSVSNILIDSRRFSNPNHCLFIALPGTRHDGHGFLEDLYSKGVRNFLVSQPPDSLEDYPGAAFILVRNTLKAFQKLAAFHRSRFSIPVVGISGSNGKTIIKEWLFQLLQPDKHIARSPKSFNSQVGVPLSVLQLADEHQLGLFEAGISEPDEMQALQAIIQPTIGIFSNLGEAHDENFLNRQQKAGEKLSLFIRVKTLIYCLDHQDIREAIIKAELSRSISTFTWSKSNKGADIQVLSEHASEGLTRIEIKSSEGVSSFSIPFTDRASFENAMHCYTLMKVMGYTDDIIRERMLTLAPVAMRLELKEGINDCSIINDSYNSDLNSLSIAIDFLVQQNQHRKRTVILSDILQSGRNEIELYEDVARLLREKGIDRLIGIGPAISRQAGKFDIEKAFYPDTQSFLRYQSTSVFQDESILLKGARVFEFELINKALQQKSHQTVLEINLNAVVHNLNYYRSLLKPETGIMAMVKAFSYGSGSYEIANLLQFHHVDYLAVAYADEGVELRRSGIRLPIMVMSPEPQGMESLLRHDLEPEIFSFSRLTQLEQAIVDWNHPLENPVRIHLKLDTGMHRLGFQENELQELSSRIRANRNLEVRTVFSHLAAADDSGHDNYTREQIRRFKRMAEQLEQELGHHLPKHILNSSGTLRFAEAQFDMVRLGIGMYGVETIPSLHGNLENVATLKTRISQVRTLEAGETVGYSRSGQISIHSRIGTIPLGYADGLSRSLGNGRGHIWINGSLVPIIGNICMDMCMIDLTGTEAEEGDEVIIFGKEHPIQQMAEAGHTIPYEILAGISRRVKRVYYHE